MVQGNTITGLCLPIRELTYCNQEKNPKENIRFLTFFVNTIKAIHDYSDILRSSIATASNDHRLGGHEAPPAIISVFIGQQLTKMLDNLEKNVKSGTMTPDEKTALKLNIGKIPELMLDNTDRNRTSPFAFTGNKFEFRAVGSTANCATPMIALNTIIAKQLQEFKNSTDARNKERREERYGDSQRDSETNQRIQNYSF